MPADSELLNRNRESL